MGHEEAELVGGRPADVARVAAATGLGLFDGPLDRHDDVAEVRLVPGGSGNAVCARRWRPERRTPAGSGNDSTSVGPALPMCVALSCGQLGVVGEDQPDRAGRGRARRRAADDAATTRAAARRGIGRLDAVAARSTSTRQGLDAVDRLTGVTRRWPIASAARRGAPRLELDDLVLRVGDPRVVHAEQLLDERLPDLLEVAQREVALVELAVVDALVDDPA